MCGDLVNMNANQVFCLVIAVLVLQIINIQLQQCLSFSFCIRDRQFHPKSSARLCFPIAHVDQPNGLSELFVPISSICHTFFLFV